MHWSMNSVQRRFTELDFSRLERLVVLGALPRLEAILNASDVVPAPCIPANVVTMYSRLALRDLKTQDRQVLVVCHPRDAECFTGHVSVLSPAGMGLIGLAAGDIARWTGPGGEENLARIEEVLFQPEAAGDFVT